MKKRPMLKEIISRSEAETNTLARKLAASLPSQQIILLEGNLGAGKSVFARALIRELAQDQELTVPSPTFTLLQTYETARGPVWHYDLYRLKDPDEIEELSWDDALSSGIVLIEWAEKLEHLKPSGLTIHIESVPGSDESRKITITDET